MSEASYRPIDCGFHDELLARAIRKVPVEVVYTDERGGEAKAVDLIEDVFARDSAEFLRLKSGVEIRLDKLVRVDGISAPDESASSER